MELMYFGAIDENDLEEYYETSLLIGDTEIELDINFDETEIDKTELVKANNLLKSIDSFVDKAWDAISDDFDAGDEPESTTVFYLSHHLDCIGSA